METVGQGFAFTEEQAALTLKALASGDTKSRFGYVSSGKLFTLDAAGALTAAEHPAAQPCAWPIAHAVRPAAQSLGARKCTDCHSAQAPFFFATVTAVGPLKTARAHTQRMYTFEGQDGNFQRLFGLTFLVRSCFKAVMFTAAGIVAALLLLYGLPALHRLTKYLAARD